jgi:hypothetical protein
MENDRDDGIFIFGRILRCGKSIEPNSGNYISLTTKLLISTWYLAAERHGNFNDMEFCHVDL